MTHTPGPWKISGCQLGSKLLIEHGTEDTLSPCIAAVYSDGGRLPQHSNAHLIAAAPDLLKQLKSAAEMLNYLAPEKFDDDDHETNWNRMLEDMNHAIAKAEGRQ